MPLTPIKTISDGPVSIFHALLGKEQNGVYSCPDIQIHLKKLAEKAPELTQLFNNPQGQSPANIAYPPIKLNTLPQWNFIDPFSDAIYDSIAQNLKITIQLCEKGGSGIFTPKKTYNQIPGQQVKSIYFNPALGNYEALEETHETSELKNTLHGNIYQLKLLMLFLHRGYKQGYQFKLATEMKAAEKFDDWVLEYQKPGDTPPSYFFLQAKHKQDDGKNITDTDLLNINDGDFSLAKYFSSFKKIKKDTANFATSISKHFYICTNIALQTQWSVRQPDANELFDNFFSMGEKHQIRHLPIENKTLYDHLKSLSEGNILAGTLIKYIFGKKSKQITLKKPIFEEHHVNLANAGIIQKGKLTLSFINGTITTPSWVNQFRTLLIRKARAVLRDVTHEDLFIMQKIAEKMKATSTFGQTNGARVIILEVEVVDQQIHDFLESLVFAVKQPNEVRLGEIIAAELGNEYNLIDSSLIYAEFEKYMLDWMKEKKGTFLTQTSASTFFDAMKKKLNGLILVGPTLNYQHKLNAFGLDFVASTAIQEFIEPADPRTAMIYQISSNTLLGSMQVYQTLQPLPPYQKKDSYIFISLKKAMRLKKEIIDAFIQRQLLVLICEQTPSTDEMDQLIKPLLSNSTSARKIIFITPHGQPLREMIHTQKLPLIDEAITWFSLSEASRTSLKAKNILFQGSEVQLDSLSDQLEHVIDADVLFELLATPMISIGKPLEQPKEQFYVKRTFNSARIKKTNLSLNNSEIFAITGISKDKLISIVGKKHPVFLFDELELNQKQPLKRHIILNTDPKIASTQFEQLRGPYSKHNIHYLRYEGKKFLWQKTQGSLTELRALTKPSEVPQLVDSIYTILSAEPGMGKSMWLPHFAHDLKKQYPDSWIYFTNLLAQEKFLKKIEFNDINDVITFFTQGTSALEQRLIVDRLKDKGKIIICLDSFDELQAPQQTKVIQLLQLLKNTKVQKVIVTTRTHLQVTLEDTLNTFAHGLTPFTEEDVLSYLQQYWQLTLNSLEIGNHIVQSRIRQYAETLFNVFSASIKNADQFIGVPLQAKLLAEAFAEEMHAFCIKSNEEVPRIAALSLYTLYLQFIQAKYRIIFQEKTTLYGSNQFFTIQHFLINGLDKAHQYYALKLLFPSAPSLTRDVTESRDAIQTAGILQFFEESPHFIHRTFAEYFAAQFFIQQLKKPIGHLNHLHYKRFLISEIFKTRHSVIKTFIDSYIEQAKIPDLSNAWKKVCQSHFLPHQAKHFVFETESETKTTTNLSESQKPPTLTELKEQVLRARRWVAPEDINNVDNSVLLYCQQLLVEQNPSTIKDAIVILTDTLTAARLNKIKDSIYAYLPMILFHYTSLCYWQSIAWDGNTLKSIINQVVKNDKDFIEVNQALYCLDPTAPLPDNFIYTAPSEKILVYVLAFRQTPLTQPILKKLTESSFYKQVQHHRIYLNLLLILAKQYPQEVRKCLLNEENYTLLRQLSILQSETTLTTTEIEQVFDTKQKKLFWLERDGIEFVMTYNLLTLNMAKVFSGILSQGTDGYYTGYANNIWRQLLMPIINNFDKDIINTGLQPHALIHMFAHFMAFSLKESTYWRFPPTTDGLKNLLILIKQVLNNNLLPADSLSDGVNLLYYLTQYGLIFIDKETTLLILDPNGEFEDSLELTYHQQIKELLLFKAEYSKDDESFTNQCKLIHSTITNKANLSDNK